ncbi:hypothetical protein ACLBWS_06150 [Brucellaceae bacterium D45D]
MTWSANKLRTGLAIPLLSVLALMLVGFAHKPVDPGAPNAYVLAQLRLPDGSYPVLCIGNHASGEDHQEHGKHANNTACEACRISAAFLCPAPASSTGSAPHIAIAHVIVSPQPVLKRNAYPPSAPPQAPPLA